MNIFLYQDYRRFLQDWYRKAKEARGSFSFRTFARKAGFRTSNFMMLVMQGKRNLTEESLNKFATGLGLNKQEQEFFRNLVFLGQSKTPEEKELYYQRLLQSRKFNQLKPIERRQYEYYSAWYHPAVRELIVSKDFDGTPESISRRLFPAVTPAQVEKSIQLLEDLGFIKKVGRDRWEQASSIVSTGPELTSVVVHHYHKILLDLSREMMDRLPLKDRDTSALTLGVKRGNLPLLRQRIRDFRQELLKSVAEDSEPEEVVQLNIQFYPLTRKV